jgi:hypothetical protein
MTAEDITTSRPLCDAWHETVGRGWWRDYHERGREGLAESADSFLNLEPPASTVTGTAATALAVPVSAAIAAGAATSPSIAHVYCLGRPDVIVGRLIDMLHDADGDIYNGCAVSPSVACGMAKVRRGCHQRFPKQESAELGAPKVWTVQTQGSTDGLWGGFDKRSEVLCCSVARDWNQRRKE